MMPGRKYTPCEAYFTLDLLRGRWKACILLELWPGPMRTGQLMRALGGIAKNRLNDNLRQLESSGFVRRKSYKERIPRVEYELTPLGNSLCPVMESLHEWALSNKSKVRQCREARRHRL